MAESPKFWDKIAKKYAKRPVADEAAYQKKLQVTRDYFRPEMNVLEVGCGTGTTAISHAPYVSQIHGVDISSKMIEIACKKAAAQGVANVTFEQSTISGFQASNETYDVIMAHSVLHLLESKEAAIVKIKRLLKPGGFFISGTACLGDKMSYFKIIAPIGKFFGFFPLVKIFTRQELLNSITDGGFEIEYQWQPEKAMSVFVVAKKSA